MKLIVDSKQLIAKPGNSSVNRKRLSVNCSGFTLIEILIVIGMLAIVSGFGLFMSMETYRASNYHSDRNLLIATLMRARAEAINNICLGGACTDALPHGVHIQTNAYIMFQGSTYDPSDPQNSSFEADIYSSHSFSGDVIFSQLSGTTSAPIAITLNSAGRTSNITISRLGRISWTQ
jgi:prepilin-type N-terminal cleavage/methylation domain-containing protein